MKRPLFLVFFAAALVAAGCQTPQDRIAARRDLFTAYPPEVQAKIQAGQVAVGFTTDQVLMARGDPDRKTARETPNGLEEDWWYGDHRARLGIGVGAASFGPNSGVSGGAAVGGIPLGANRELHVMFENGRVIAFEAPKPGS